MGSKLASDGGITGFIWGPDGMLGEAAKPGCTPDCLPAGPGTGIWETSPLDIGSKLCGAAFALGINAPEGAELRFMGAPDRSFEEAGEIG